MDNPIIPTFSLQSKQQQLDFLSHRWQLQKKTQFNNPQNEIHIKNISNEAPRVPLELLSMTGTGPLQGYTWL